MLGPVLRATGGVGVSIPCQAAGSSKDSRAIRRKDMGFYMGGILHIYIYVYTIYAHSCNIKDSRTIKEMDIGFKVSIRSPKASS